MIRESATRQVLNFVKPIWRNPGIRGSAILGILAPVTLRPGEERGWE